MKKQIKSNLQTQLLFVLMTVGVLIFFANFSVAAQGKFKVGDRVECDPTQMGRFSKGTVVPYAKTDLDQNSGRWYRVKLDEDTIPNSTVECMTTRMRLIQAENTDDTENEARDKKTAKEIPKKNNKEKATPKKSPKKSGAPRSLNGTAWKIDFGKGVTGTVFLFCKGGKRWEIVPARAGSIGAVGKSWTVSGSTLTTVNADDGMVQKWKMNWEDDVLAINDGKETLRLHYNGETQCQ